MRTTRTTVGLAAVTMLTLALTACGSDDSGSSGPSGEVGDTDLAAAGCPDTVVVQTDWNPESEHGGLYQLLGDDYEIDAGAKRVSGTLVDSNGDSTGVKLEIRAGGPAIGFQTVTSQMYSDDAITLGYIATDEAIQLSDTQPTTAVLAPLEISPTMIMWDPETYPDVTSIADLGKDATVLWDLFHGHHSVPLLACDRHRSPLARPCALCARSCALCTDDVTPTRSGRQTRAPVTRRTGRSAGLAPRGARRRPRRRADRRHQPRPVLQVPQPDRRRRRP